MRLNLAMALIPLINMMLKMAIPIVMGANRSRLVRLETIPWYFLETEFMIMFDAGVSIRPNPKPIRSRHRTTNPVVVSGRIRVILSLIHI